MRLSMPAAEDFRLVDLERIATALHEAFHDAEFSVQLEVRRAVLRLSWELFDDPTARGKVLVVRFQDPEAPPGQRMAGKLTCVVRPHVDRSVMIDCMNPFHGVNLRPGYQRQGVVSNFLRQVVMPRLPPGSIVAAPVAPGSAAGVALEFFRSYMEQRKGGGWLSSDEGRDWWRGLPENREVDWAAAGGFPPLFGLFRAVGLRAELLDSDRVLARYELRAG